MSRHHLFNPPGMASATGFSYGAATADGQTIYIAGLTGHHADGSIAEDIVAQFGVACESVAKVVSEAGGEPSDVVSVIIYTSDIAQYRENLKPIGEAYRSVFDSHYPPMALLGVSELFDPVAKVELVCTAVVQSSRT